MPRKTGLNRCLIYSYAHQRTLRLSTNQVSWKAVGTVNFKHVNVKRRRGYFNDRPLISAGGAHSVYLRWDRQSELGTGDNRPPCSEVILLLLSLLYQGAVGFLVLRTLSASQQDRHPGTQKHKHTHTHMHTPTHKHAHTQTHTNTHIRTHWLIILYLWIFNNHASTRFFITPSYLYYQGLAGWSMKTWLAYIFRLPGLIAFV